MKSVPCELEKSEESSRSIQLVSVCFWSVLILLGSLWINVWLHYTVIAGLLEAFIGIIAMSNVESLWL